MKRVFVGWVLSVAFIHARASEDAPMHALFERSPALKAHIDTQQALSFTGIGGVMVYYLHFSVQKSPIHLQGPQASPRQDELVRVFEPLSAPVRPWQAAQPNGPGPRVDSPAVHVTRARGRMYVMTLQASAQGAKGVLSVAQGESAQAWMNTNSTYAHLRTLAMRMGVDVGPAAQTAVQGHFQAVKPLTDKAQALAAPPPQFLADFTLTGPLISPLMPAPDMLKAQMRAMGWRPSAYSLSQTETRWERTGSGSSPESIRLTFLRNEAPAPETWMHLHYERRS